MMNLQTKESNLLSFLSKDLKIENCYGIWSFEDKVLIQTKENYIYNQKLFKFKEGELQLLDEKIDSAEFWGFGNLGILHNLNQLLNFTRGKLWFSENKVERDKCFYNSLVGPTEYPEFTVGICLNHLLYQQELAKKDKFITSRECKLIFGKFMKE